MAFLAAASRFIRSARSASWSTSRTTLVLFSLLMMGFDRVGTCTVPNHILASVAPKLWRLTFFNLQSRRSEPLQLLER